MSWCQMRAATVCVVSAMALSLVARPSAAQRSDLFNRIFSNFRSLNHQPEQNRFTATPAKKSSPSSPAAAVPVLLSSTPTVARPTLPHTDVSATIDNNLYYSWRDPALGKHAKFTWQQADTACRTRGQTLVSLQTRDKSNFVTRQVDNDGVEYIWTSGRRQGAGWVWLTGEVVEPLNWSTRGFTPLPQPDNREGDEDCLAILNRFYPGDGVTWHDVACGYRKPFVCE